MSNTISHRIYDFLKEHPPFIFIAKEDLVNIADTITVSYFENGSILFKQGEIAPAYFYVVREGAVKLYNEFKSQQILIDVCDEGDIFGIRPLISADKPFTLTAIVSEESLVYKIPTSSFLQIIKTNKNVENYFSSSFAGGIRNPYSSYSKHQLLRSNENSKFDNVELNDIQTIQFNNNPITCKSSTTIKIAAKIMKENNIGSIVIVNKALCPIGIITDRDLRNKVVAEEMSAENEVSKIMNSSPITVDPKLTTTDLQILMIKNNIHYVCVTEDGTTNSKIIGVISEHDILVARGNDLSMFIRDIKRAKEPEHLIKLRLSAEKLLKTYLLQEVSISYISRIVTEINNVLNVKAIEISISNLLKEGKDIPNVKWCWLALGSYGREEQLFMTDQDNALVFENVSETEYDKVKNYFVLLAKSVNAILEKCGFKYCPANVMASNPNWCLSFNQWNQMFDKWIYTPGEKELMHSTIFFDFNPIYGDFELAKGMMENIYKSIESQESFLSFLARNALENPPPLSFFRYFMVEQNGEHKDEFDIKARAIMPLVDAARVLSLDAKITNEKRTIAKFNKLAEIEPENKELFEQLSDVYEILLRFKAIQGLKHNNSGRYFKPSELNKMERLMLHNCFKPIKELQTILTVRFNLKMFR